MQYIITLIRKQKGILVGKILNIKSIWKISYNSTMFTVLYTKGSDKIEILSEVG